MKGVYKIACKPTGYVYIGCSVNIENRWRQHVYTLNSGTHGSKLMIKHWNKYGKEAFTFEVVIDLSSDPMAELTMYAEERKYRQTQKLKYCSDGGKPRKYGQKRITKTMRIPIEWEPDITEYLLLLSNIKDPLTTVHYFNDLLRSSLKENGYL